MKKQRSQSLDKFIRGQNMVPDLVHVIEHYLIVEYAYKILSFLHVFFFFLTAKVIIISVAKGRPVKIFGLLLFFAVHNYTSSRC